MHVSLKLLFRFKCLRICDNIILLLSVSVAALYCQQVYFWNRKTQRYSRVVGDTWKVSFSCYSYCIVVVVVVLTSPSGNCLYEGTKMSRRDEEFYQTLNPEGSFFPRDSCQPFINWGTTQGRLSLPTADVLWTIVKRSMLTDVDKLSSCSRFSNSVVGFTGQKT